MCGGTRPVYFRPLHFRLHYFDPEARRPGVPPDVGALVDEIGTGHLCVHLVNIDHFRSKTVLIQGGVSRLRIPLPGSPACTLTGCLRPGVRGAPDRERGAGRPEPRGGRHALHCAAGAWGGGPAARRPDALRERADGAVSVDAVAARSAARPSPRLAPENQKERGVVYPACAASTCWPALDWPGRAATLFVAAPAREIR